LIICWGGAIPKPEAASVTVRRGASRSALVRVRLDGARAVREPPLQLVPLEVDAIDRNRQNILATVQNGTAELPSRCHYECMLDKKTTNEPLDATRASVSKEMAKPRMARSARIAELNLDTTRIPAHPSATMSGTVDKIIPSPRPSQPEKARIAVDGADDRHRDLRIENTFTDGHGDDVRLKKRTHVDVTVTAATKTSAAAIEADTQLTRRETGGPGSGRHKS
jgi:hypothetical protein